MVERPRLSHLHALIQDLLVRNVPGDMIEAGCWRGGVAILMAACLEGYEAPGLSTPPRVLWFADSFEGIPEVDLERFPGDGVHAGADGIDILKQNSEEEVRRSVRAMGLEHRARFLKVGLVVRGTSRAAHVAREKGAGVPVARSAGLVIVMRFIFN